MKKEILHCAINLLSRREHSGKELINKLKQRDFVIDDIMPVIDFLISEDYLSDEKFADCVIRHRVSRGYGWRYIQNELNQKGVNSSIINNVIKNHQIDWYLQAELAYNKRFGASAIEDQKEKAKRIRFLQYRGFSTEEIMTTLQTE
ncbi:regulatory protein RecX [Colwelliaceae bacterium 6471]